MTEPVLFAKTSPLVPLYDRGKVSPCFTERESGTPRIEKGFSGMTLLLSARKSPQPPFTKGGLGGFPRL